DLAEQYRLSKQLYDEWLALNSISESVRRMRGQIAELRPQLSEGDLKTHIDAFAEKLTALAGSGGGGPGGGAAAAAARPSAASITGRIRTLFGVIEDVDLAPTPQVSAAVPDVVKDSRALQETWQTIKLQDIPALNQELRAAGLVPIGLPK